MEAQWANASLHRLPLLRSKNEGIIITDINHINDHVLFFLVVNTIETCLKIAGNVYNVLMLDNN